jgi:hypothetical protein
VKRGAGASLDADRAPLVNAGLQALTQLKLDARLTDPQLGEVIKTLHDDETLTPPVSSTAAPVSSTRCLSLRLVVKNKSTVDRIDKSPDTTGRKRGSE